MSKVSFQAAKKLHEERHITYKASFANICGGVLAGILFNQVLHWSKGGEKSFFKFMKPCKHKLYKAGDSWTEELGFTISELNQAFKRLDARDLVFKKTTIERLTYYEVNLEAYEEALSEFYVNQESRFTKSGITSYPDQESGFCTYTEKQSEKQSEKEGQDGREPEITNQEKSSPALVEPKVSLCDSRMIFDHWVKSTGRTERTVFSPERKKLISKAINSHGYDICRSAINGNVASDFHRGMNDRNTPFDEIERILKNASNIERFAAMENRKPSTNLSTYSNSGVVDNSKQRIIDRSKETAQRLRARVEASGQTGA